MMIWLGFGLEMWVLPEAVAVDVEKVTSEDVEVRWRCVALWDSCKM